MRYYITDVHSRQQIERRYPFASAQRRRIAWLLPIFVLVSGISFVVGMAAGILGFVTNLLVLCGTGFLLALAGILVLVLVVVPVALLTDRLEELRMRERRQPVPEPPPAPLRTEIRIARPTGGPHESHGPHRARGPYRPGNRPARPHRLG